MTDAKSARDMSMLELELELAYREAEDRVDVESPVGIHMGRVITAGSFVAVVVPWDDPDGAEEFAGRLPGRRVEVRRRSKASAA